MPPVTRLHLSPAALVRLGHLTPECPACGGAAPCACLAPVMGARASAAANGAPTHADVIELFDAIGNLRRQARALADRAAAHADDAVPLTAAVASALVDVADALDSAFASVADAEHAAGRLR